MLYAYAKQKSVDFIEKGEGHEYNVIRIGGETEEELKANLENYIAGGYEIATEEEWVADSTPVKAVESEEAIEPVQETEESGQVEENVSNEGTEVDNEANA